VHIQRSNYLEKIEKAFKVNSICCLLGPRQCGKTTLALDYAKTQPGMMTHFDLEDPDHLRALLEPKLNLTPLTGLVIIDEVQRMPELFPYLRVISDTRKDLQIMILGSASQDLIRQSSESLAGRISYIYVTPFQLLEFPKADALWLRGGLPKSTLANSDSMSYDWRKDYVKTFLERDIPSFGFSINPQLIRRFWHMLADYHSQIFNASELGRALDLDAKTIRRYLDILTGTFMIRTLQPWFANITKRQVKSPKVFFRDAGLYHYFLGLKTQEDLVKSSKIGASWEGFAMETLISLHDAEDQDCYFWATPSGAELDLIISQGNQLKAFEFKYSSYPKLTKSMISSIQYLGLDHLTVIVPGNISYRLHELVTVVGLEKWVRPKNG
jgi:predicted AAA+ superfamily ATPase